MSKRCSRRSFVKGSATAFGGVLASVASGPFVLAGRSASDKLRVAVIGAVGMWAATAWVAHSARTSWLWLTWTRSTLPRS